MKSILSRRLKCGLFFGCFLSLAVQAEQNPVFSIRLKQAPLVPTLQQLALAHNTNLIIDDELQGTVSLQLENVDLDQLFRSVAKIKQLDLWQENGIYYFTKGDTNTKFAGKMEEPFPLSLPMAEEPAQLTTATIKLHFAKASEVMKSLTGGSGSLLSPNGSITFDDRSNLLLIQDEPRSVRNIKKLIKELDKPIEQIAIEARIVTINDESLKELGVRWGIFSPTDNAHRIGGSLAGNGFDNLVNQLNVNFPTTTTPAGSVALQVAKINGRLLDLELTALERENNVEIIASPRLLTTNKKSASIKQGTELPYILVNEKSGSQSVEFREAVLGLEVTPHISQDKQILLDLIVSQNSPGSRVAYGLGEVVSIDKQEINTQVFAKDGETIVLGGVFSDTITKGTDKVPVLGDIPGIKHLFSKESERHQKRELVIFVTPHILRKGETPDAFKQKRIGVNEQIMAKGENKKDLNRK
ncbi:type IV pilus secretin PilQ [Aggregatibacter actinomycetemcomitans]|uniref:Secretin n=1 Tax=Aggregatibacter actinomycetemcomitans serotype C (strain D11S-1) TaxID=668336 RepID=A0ABF7PFQ5_AGGAD|nr:type IV pilus secretin PilQ [Aggregatibacter actinomycetemcomitans]ACX81862.1 secretin [Aggregatibacter actinomycetemcomitans D11S-1]KOE59114.1 secretin [Aggregatibacter actinomycetemcomitans serotype c str. D17P-2]KOE59437.1 secretin [Aggregatibacter actinomycetemcomitans serotype c str. AAS4A]KYK76061.1 secretin [Aggregatibacter actinomycetemcomitans serotype e str. SA2149]KYK78123.1 secretin [Aggregatibacter actinomycetemcomitans SC383s]